MISQANAQQMPSAAKSQTIVGETQSPTKSKDQLSKVNAAIEKQQEHIATLSKSPEPQPQLTWWTTTSAMTMSAAVLVFGLLTLALAAYVIRKGHPWEAVLKIFGMVLIIVLAVFLIVAGYDDKQIAPAMGLLGTIAGYLLGKDISRTTRASPATGEQAEASS
jgi:hypothetical protein